METVGNVDDMLKSVLGRMNWSSNVFFCYSTGWWEKRREELRWENSTVFADTSR